MVSFFFTPIYMLTLVFIVYFGPKKASPSTYGTPWGFLYHTSLSGLVHVASYGGLTLLRRLAHRNLFRFQYTLITARPTVYVLLGMWIFFYSFGDFFLSFMFNYNTLVDTIPSGCFTYIKTHTIFMTESSNAYLSDSLFMFILFLLSSAILFLVGLKTEFSYSYFRFSY
jgi:hypothetical protein